MRADSTCNAWPSGSVESGAMTLVSVQERDEDLAIQAGAGDRPAFAELVRRYTPLLWRTCRRLLGDASEAEDAVQESFLKAWQALPRYEARGRLAGWLASIAQRVCLDRLRARREWSQLSAEPSAPAPPLSYAERDEVAQALSDLAPRERVLIHAKYTLGMSGPEIAAELSLSPGNVRVLLHRALRSLRAALAPPTGGPDV